MNNIILFSIKSGEVAFFMSRGVLFLLRDKPLGSRLPSCKIKSGRKRRRIKNKILIVKTRMMIKNANKTVNCYFTLNQSAISSRNDS